MTINQIIFANLLSLILLFFVYKHTGFKKIKYCYVMFFKKKYWTDYNTVEFVSWLAN